MAEVVLFHHAQGLTAGVASLAEDLRAAGHVVHTPDLFDARTFPTLDEGLQYAEEIGFEAILQRGVSEGEAVGPGRVYAGISLGVMPAQKLAQTLPEAAGALFIDACVPIEYFGDGWPDGLPVQIHGMDSDPIFAGEGDLEAARALVETGARAELFLYPGDVHLFSDSSLPSYDREATKLMTARAVDFLNRLT